MLNITNRTRVTVEEIIDTRNYDSNFKPIPGSGDPTPCEHCGKIIEVQAIVSVFDIEKKEIIQRAIIGTECCKKIRASFCNGVQATNKDYWISKKYAK